MRISDEIMILRNGKLIASIMTEREGKAYTATLEPITPEAEDFFPCAYMTRRSAVEKVALRDVLAHALVSGANPTVGRMSAHDIAAAHGLTLESVFLASTLAPPLPTVPAPTAKLIGSLSIIL